MGTIEMINFGMSAFGSGGMTIVSNLINGMLQSNIESSKLKHSQEKDAHEETEKSQGKAREFKGQKGFHSTRQWIAKKIIWCYFVLPLTLPFIASLLGMPVTIMLGYYDMSQGWPWQQTMETVEWVTIGGAPNSFPIVITPVMNNTVITIVGMFFGNQMVKSKF